ncbi:MAG: macro domain-containing protein [Pseudonocardiales bacterium]|nr:macro domain-containing protein [Pseudonocardiales bacterium]MBV9032714.1 macro domain-containing protein [Pseudonocardiales bacterium]MBW0011201.1 macro domain-containing protein [Pseudonocardiales bacterium]
MTLAKGDVLRSQAQAIVNTVNCVGIMGKGVALAFKHKYPEMYRDYVARCNDDEVRVGKPYAYESEGRIIVNFPTKQHWRSVSRLSDIEAGLRHLRAHLNEWGITSIALPPLGCGNGQLDWSVVGPTLHKHLSTFGIPVELYVPHEVPLDDAQRSLIDVAQSPVTPPHKVQDSSVALVAILADLEESFYHWPVGRVILQKIAYFATAGGLPTGLEFEAASYGPFAPGLKRELARLQDNGLVREERRGRMFEVTVGPTFAAAHAQAQDFMTQWREVVERVSSLFARFDTRQAEVAATVHYAAAELRTRLGRAPFASEVLKAVEQWKINRKPPLTHENISRAIVCLATQGWIDVVPDASVEKSLDEFALL